MIFAIDVDGVVCDTHTSWLAMYNKDYGDNMKYSDITEWGLHNLVKPECGKSIYKYLSLPHLYRHSYPIPYALEGVNFIRSQGHKVLFVTSGFFPAKAKWLSDNGFLELEGDYLFSPEIIFCSDKSNIKADVIIDDNPDNLDGFDFQILYSQPWNRSHAITRSQVRTTGWLDIMGVNNWNDLIDMLEGVW